MGNACKPFNFNIDDGTRAFCVAEMIIAIFHIIMAVHSHDLASWLNSWASSTQFDFLIFLAMVLYYISLVCLVIQAIFAFLLYFLGYLKRNVTVCFIWIIIAISNLALPVLAYVFILIHAAIRHSKQKKANEEDAKAGGYQPVIPLFSNSLLVKWSQHNCYLYLLYVCYGVWIVMGFMKWAKATGVAVRFQVAPAPADAEGASQAGHSTKSPEPAGDDD